MTKSDSPHTADIVERLGPCPFCGQHLTVVESWARSFDPPRLYREYHHNPMGYCVIGRQRWTFSETDETARQEFIAAWNTRTPDPEAAATIERLNDWLVETQMRAHKWMEAHDKLKMGRPYDLPQPADLPDALTEAAAEIKALREVQLKAIEMQRAACSHGTCIFGNVTPQVNRAALKDHRKVQP